MRERADEAVLEEAPADIRAGLEPAGRIDQAEEAGAVALMIEREALDHQWPLVHAVLPVRVEAVAGADHHVHGQHGCAAHLERTARRLGKGNRGGDHELARLVENVLVPWRAQPLRLALRIGPDAHRFLELALAAVQLVADVENRVIIELHGAVVPHAAHAVGALMDAGGLVLAHRADAPGAVAAAFPAVGRDSNALAVDLEPAGPAAGLGEAHRIKEHPALAAHVLARLEESGNGAFPGDVHGDAPLVGLEHKTHPLQALEHLDADGPHGGVGAVAELARCAHHAVGVALAQRDEGVLHGKRRVLAQAHHHEQLATRVMHVEVVAIVEIAVGTADVADGVRDLMQGVVVHRRERLLRLPARHHDMTPS